MKTRFQLYLNRSGALAASWAERFLPDPWIYAVLLTVTAYCAGLTIDSMNLAFLVATLMLYRTPRDMLEQVSRSSQGVGRSPSSFPFMRAYWV